MNTFFFKYSQIYGHVTGRHLDQFLANPSLLQANAISASCHFSDIVVDGSIQVKSTKVATPLLLLLFEINENIPASKRISASPTGIC